MHLWLLKQKSFEAFMNKIAIKKTRGNDAQAWMTNQLIYITRSVNPMEAFKTWAAMNDENIHSERIEQDVLLLSGANDHFIPIKMHQKQIDALIHARSITDKIFTEEDNAQNHCQIGNITLLLDTVIDWMNET
jgi:hypothetical protein